MTQNMLSPGDPNVLMVLMALMAGPCLPASVSHSLGGAQVGLAVGQGGSAADVWRLYSQHSVAGASTNPLRGSG